MILFESIKGDADPKFMTYRSKINFSEINQEKDSMSAPKKEMKGDAVLLMS
jgi:hypothetical protein